MRLEWSGLRRPAVPAEAAEAIDPAGGEKLLAWAHDVGTGATVVAGRHRLYAVAPDPEGARVTLSRPWHLVDAGSWGGEDGILKITWVDGQRPTRFQLTELGMFPETLRERVQASVVLAETLGSVGAAIHAGEGKIVVGNTLSVWEIVVTDEDGKRVCTSRITCLVRQRPPGS